MNVIIFLGFYLFTYFLGRGFLVLIKTNFEKSIDENQILGIKYDVFYPIISLFVFGNLLVILNFFIPLDSSYPILIGIALILFFSNFGSKFKIYNFKNWTLKHLVLPSIISITSYGSWLHFDTGAYHLNYQYWIKTSKIVFGLANINFGYGFSSILEYLESLLWVGNNFVFLYFINQLFYVLLFAFLWDAIFSSNSFLKISSLFLLIYGFLDNFGIGGGANGFYQVQAIAKPDMPFGIMFIIISQLFCQKIINKDYRYKDLKIFSFAVLFLIQIKLLGMYIGLFVIYYLFKFNKNNKIKILRLFNEIKVPIVLSIIWLSKNFILSGCFLFPLTFSCIKNVSWYIDGYINSYVYDTQVSQRAYFFGENINEWIILYLNKGFNRQILINFLIGIFIFLLIRMIFLQKVNVEFPKLVLLSFNIIFIFTWIISSPAPRWGAHIYPFVIISLALGFELKNKNILNSVFSNLVLIFFLLTVGLMPRFYSYQSFFDTELGIYEVNYENVEYVNNSSNTGYIVDSSKYQPQQCWVNKMCTLSDKEIIQGKIGTYSVFYPDGSKLW
tara:strand:+ start:7437 stop:9107 length:1671 start_codon:yes stop_codon:yes gene_type:complete